MCYQGDDDITARFLPLLPLLPVCCCAKRREVCDSVEGNWLLIATGEGGVDDKFADDNSSPHVTFIFPASQCLQQEKRPCASFSSGFRFFHPVLFQKLCRLFM